MALSVLVEFLLIFLYICAPSSYASFSFLLLVDVQFFCLNSFLQWTQKEGFSDPDFREEKLPVSWGGELNVAGRGGSRLAGVSALRGDRRRSAPLLARGGTREPFRHALEAGRFLLTFLAV